MTKFPKNDGCMDVLPFVLEDSKNLVQYLQYYCFWKYTHKLPRARRVGEADQGSGEYTSFCGLKVVILNF